MRFLLVALLCALSYAQTERSSRLRNIRLLPLGVPDEMSRDELTQMVAAGLNMNALRFPETRISESDAWMYSPDAIRLARTRAPHARLGEYPLGTDKKELRMWDWLKKNDYVVGGKSRLLSKPRAQQARRQYLPDLEYEELMPLISQWSGSTNAWAPYAMGEESYPFYYADIINNAATGNASFSEPASNTNSGLPTWAFGDAEEYLPYASQMYNQGASRSTQQVANNPAAAMITAKWSGEDWKQYNAYLMGAAIDGVDTGELAQYQQVAQMTGHNIASLPQAPGMFSFGGIVNGYGGFSALQNGGVAGLPQVNTAAFANIPSTTVQQASSYMPMLFMEPEEQQEYMMYKQGMYSSNMDQEEIMRYNQYNTMAGGAPVQWTNGPFAGSSTAFAPTMLRKTHQIGQTNPTYGMDGEEALPYLIQQNRQKQKSATNQVGYGDTGMQSQQQGGLSPAMMAMMMGDSFGEGGAAEGDFSPMMSMIPGVVNGYMNGGVGGASMAAMAMMGDMGDMGDMSPMMLQQLIGYFNQNPVSGVNGNQMAQMGMAAMAMMTDNEEMLPMIMASMGQMGGGGMGAGGMGMGGAGMMPAMVFDGEDMQQYINYIHGIITEGMDSSELQRYAAMAQSQGIKIPGPMGMGMGAGGATASTGTVSGSGDTGSSVPNYSGAMGTGFNPMMMLDNEKMRDYNLYINGILTSNMDPSEIAMYQQIARASGVTPKSYSYMPTGMGGMNLQTPNPEPVLQAAQMQPHQHRPTGPDSGWPRSPFGIEMSDLMEDLREGVKDARMMPGKDGKPQLVGNMDGDAYINAMRMGMDPKKVPLPREGLDRKQMQELFYIQQHQQQKSDGNSTAPVAPSLPAFNPEYELPEMERPEMEDIINPFGAMSNIFNNMKNNAPQNPFGFPMPQFHPMKPPKMPEMEDIIKFNRWKQMMGGNTGAPTRGDTGTGFDSSKQMPPKPNMPPQPNMPGGHWGWVWVPNEQ